MGEDDKTVIMRTFKEFVPKQKCDYVLTSSLKEDEFFKCFPRKAGFDDHGNSFKMANKTFYKSVMTYLKDMRNNNYELEMEYSASESNPQGRRVAAYATLNELLGVILTADLLEILAEFVVAPANPEQRLKFTFECLVVLLQR